MSTLIYNVLLKVSNVNHVPRLKWKVEVGDQEEKRVNMLVSSVMWNGILECQVLPSPYNIRFTSVRTDIDLQRVTISSVTGDFNPTSLAHQPSQ